LAPDFSYTDFKIKPGNYFHKGWGEVTAEDVVYTTNEGDNRWASEEAQRLADPVNNRALPDLAFGKWEVLDKYTVRQPWADGHPPIKGLFEVSNDAYPWGVHSKKLYDEKGWEYARDNMIGSGPYEVEHQDDERWTLIAREAMDGLEDEKVPDILRWSFVAAPEYGTRLALFEAGEVAIMSSVATVDKGRLLKQGRKYQTLQNGSVNGITFHFLGNYWETTHPTTGEPLVRSVVRDMPWICPPGPDLSKPHISECNDVAKLYRQALLMGIDRQALVDAFFPGGTPILSAPINLSDPMIKKYGDRWGDAYDPERAKEIMAEWRVKYRALGKDPDSVVNHYWTNPGWALGVEIDQAIASHWEELFGIPTEFDTRPWSVWSPDAWYARKGFRMQATAAATYRGNLMSWDNEHRWSATAAPGGRNMGWESPVATRVLKEKKEAWNDVEKREQLTVEWMDHIYEQHMRIGLLEGASGDMYNSDILAGFSSRVPGIPWVIWDMAYVTMRR
jgi:ABC-type transport system substrate-binding protein